jgi:poly-gamma-glutamate capsule biosynthesis protein CapA/YwtB (metallophosphatase superfamily)
MLQISSGQEQVVRVMVGGDVMLGRGVKQAVLRYGPDYPLGPVAGMMRHADLTLVNLECALTSSTIRWQGAPKAFYFGAPPQAIHTLKGAGIDMVSLANNHVLDFGVNGLQETLSALRRHAIAFAGAGAGDNIDASLSPSVIDCGGIQFGMAAFCDHQIDFAAQQDRPGIAYIDFDDEFAAVETLRNALVPLRNADWPILSLHWGPNMVLRPTMKFCRLAHAAVDMGWKILFGHSAHVFQGIEIYHGCPIIYAAGDLVDDYHVDPKFKNDQQLLFEMEFTRSVLRRISLYPVFIKECQTRFATAEQSDSIAKRMVLLCDEMGTRVQLGAGKIWIDGTGA